MSKRSNITDSEALLLAVDFSTQMDASETILATNSYGSTTVKVYDSNGVETTGTMIESGSIDTVDQTVRARIYGATAGEIYSMCFFAATSTGNYLETKVTVRASD